MATLTEAQVFEEFNNLALGRLWAHAHESGVAIYRYRDDGTVAMTERGCPPEQEPDLDYLVTYLPMFEPGAEPNNVGKNKAEF